MTVTFNSNVFGDVNGIAPTPTAGPDGNHVLNCELGQCGMKHFIEDKK